MTGKWQQTCICMQDASLSYDPETPPSEIQSDVLFREGQTPGGHVTHTPRLIAMDLKGNFSPLKAFFWMSPTLDRAGAALYFCCDTNVLLCTSLIT